MAQNMVQGTASQQASTELHLARRDEWTYVRIAGTRYVVLPSGRSNSTYWVRADDAAGCSCLWYARTLTTCSHMRAVQMANEQDAAPPLKSYRDLFPGCVGGCGELVERQNSLCYSCSSDDAYRLDREHKRDLAKGVAS